MFNINTFNRYIDNNSIMTKINPLIKLLIFLLIITTMSVNTNINLYISYFILTITMIILSRINIIYFHKQIIFVWIFFLFFTILAYINQSPPIYYLYLFTRFYTTFHLLLLFSLTTNINTFINQLSRPLKYLLPLDTRAKLLMNIQLIYTIIPTLLLTVNDIFKAQKLRGFKLRPNHLHVYVIALILQIDPLAANLHDSFHSRHLNPLAFIDDTVRFKLSIYDLIFIILFIVTTYILY